MAKKKEDFTGADWDIVVKGLGKKFGKGLSLFQMNEDTVQMLKVDPIPTDLVALDNALGIFGFPQGRIVEIYGPESGGKTTLALQAVVSAQKLFPDKPILYVDLEHSLDPAWMKNVGVKFDNLWVAQPDSGEQATQMIVTAAESGQPSLIVLDSVAAVIPQAEIDGEMTDQQMGVVGRIMGKFCRKVVGPLQENKIGLICINQTRMKLGPMPGEERPGGKALRFFSSQILRVRKEKNITQGSDVIGVWIEVVVRKNKVAPPFRVATIPLLFEGGFSPEISLIETASTEGIIEKSGAWYSYKGEQLGQGVVNAAKALSPELFRTIYDAYKATKFSTVQLMEELPDEDTAEETEEADAV